MWAVGAESDVENVEHEVVVIVAAGSRRHRHPSIFSEQMLLPACSLTSLHAVACIAQGDRQRGHREPAGLAALRGPPGPLSRPIAPSRMTAMTPRDPNGGRHAEEA